MAIPGATVYTHFGSAEAGEDATLAKASHLTGYASEASFGHALRQWAGVTPGAWRRRLMPA